MSVRGYPADYYSTDLTVDDSDLRATGEALLTALAHEPWPAVTSWASPVGETPQASPLLEALKHGKVRQQVEWSHGDDISFKVAELKDHVWVRISMSDTEPGHAWRWLVAAEELLARLLEQGLLIRHGLVERQGTGVNCIPRFRLTGGPSYMVVADDTALAWAFERPDEVIARGGWSGRRINDCWLLSRAMHAETNVELLEAIQDGQWTMARLAKPGQARYDSIGPPRPEEEAIFSASARQVLAVGYDPATRTAMFSCAPAADAHIDGWEILALRQIVVDHRLPTGEPVDRVEVIFPDRATAGRERRPLLDVGVHVLFYAAAGQRVELAS